MTLSLITLTGKELGTIKKEQRTVKHVFKWIPKYCIRDSGKIDYAENWLQFTEDGGEVYYLFDIEHMEQPLAEEISCLGVDFLSDTMGIDLNFLRTLPAITYDRMQRSLNGNIQLVFEVTYTGGGWCGEYQDDVDIEITLVGYLNQNKELQPLAK
jgi:hypothetical protein